MRTYICLFLFAPVINLYLSLLTYKKRILLLTVLFFISIYLGTSHGDPSLSDGKNLANFLFLYVVGNTLNKYRPYWEKQKYSGLISVYIVLNVALVALYLLSGPETVMGKVIWHVSYPYCSPVLLINALLLFMIIGKTRLCPARINRLAKSTLAIFLIHSHPAFLYATGKAIPILKGLSFNCITFLLLTACYTLLIMLLCIFIDKALQPIWKCVIRLGNNANHRFYRFIGDNNK